MTSVSVWFQTNEKGQVTVKSSVLKQMDDIKEETGLTCCICREGYRCQPQKVKIRCKQYHLMGSSVLSFICPTKVTFIFWVIIKSPGRRPYISYCCHLVSVVSIVVNNFSKFFPLDTTWQIGTKLGVSCKEMMWEFMIC